MTDTGTHRVLVVGQPYDVEGSSVRELRGEALKAHGVINYRMGEAIDASWEVRDRAGMLLDPDQSVALGEPLFVHRKPGWGG